MSLIEWTGALSVGFKEIDNDHQRLVEIINDLSDAIEQKRDHDHLKETLGELIEYTAWHFRHEERLMQVNGYDDMTSHQEKHTDLAGQAVEIQGKFEAGDDSALEVLMPFLKDWLTEHIQETDKKLGQFLAEQS